MDLDRLANAHRVTAELENMRILFRQMHPSELTPVWYQISPSDIEDLAYVVHQSQRILHVLDRAIDTLERFRGEANGS